MKCADYEGLLSAYANDELSRTQREFIKEHLAVCPDCRKTLAGYTSVRQHIASLGVMEHNNTDLKEKVMSEIEGTNTKSSAWKWLRPALVTVPVAAILATLLVFQPWGMGSSPDTIFAKVAEAAENIQTYRVLNSTFGESNTSDGTITLNYEWLWEFVLPDRVHVSYDLSSQRDDKSGEFYIIGDHQYYHEDNSFKSMSPELSANAYASLAGTPSKDYALNMLQFLDDLQQLPDEEIDGIACLHYSGVPKLGNIPIEIWIGKDDYLIRQMMQKNESENSTATSTIRYYDFNADIVIEPPLDTSEELLPGWEVESIQPNSAMIPVEEALKEITGDEDWSDPETVMEVFDMMSKVDNMLAYLNALPDEAIEALKDSIMNTSQPGITVTTTESASYNGGVFRYSNGFNGLDIVIDTGWDGNKNGSAELGVTASIDLWLETAQAPDPQAYFDALPEETQQAMAVALSDNAILRTVFQQLGHIGAIEIEIP